MILYKNPALEKNPFHMATLWFLVVVVVSVSSSNVAGQGTLQLVPTYLLESLHNQL